MRRGIELAVLTGKGATREITQIELGSPAQFLDGNTAHYRVDRGKLIISGAITCIGIQLSKKEDTGNEVAARSHKPDDRRESTGERSVVGCARYHRWGR